MPTAIAAESSPIEIRVTPTKEANLVVRVLGRWPIALFASAAYLRARGTPRSAAELEGHDVLVPSGELAALPEAQLLIRARGVRVALRSSSLPALVEAATLGHGLVPISRPWGESVGLAHSFDLPNIAASPSGSSWRGTSPRGRPSGSSPTG